MYEQPWKNANFPTFFNRRFHSLQKLVFYQEDKKTPSFGLFRLKPKKVEKNSNFDQNHWLTSLEKWKLFDFFKVFL